MEKNTITISLKTVFLIVALIIIVIMGVFIYKLHEEKAETDEKVSNLEAKVNELSMQKSNINNTTTTTVESTNTTKNNNENNVEACKEQLQKFLTFRLDAQENPVTLLVDLGLVSEFDANYDETIEDGAYVLTDIKFSTFKNEMLKIISEKIYDTNFGELFKESNGYVACYNGDASEGKCEIKKFELLESKGNNYAYDVEINTEFEGTKKYNVIFEKKGDSYIISDMQSK